MRQISIPPAAELSIPQNTPTSEGVVGVGSDPVHAMIQRVIMLVVNVEFLIVNQSVVFSFACFC